MRRRDFLKTASFTAAAAALPGRTWFEGGTRSRALVVVELDGGNDGLNTVVPFGDDRYHEARPVLRLAAEQVLPLDDHSGFHPSLAPLHEWWKEGRIAIHQGVGYPNPDRSHFRSMDIWRSGIPDRIDTTSGWLGRALARHGKTPAAPAFSPFHIGGGPAPLSFSRSPWPVTSLARLEDLELRGGEAQRRAVERGRAEKATSPELAFLQGAAGDALEAARRFEAAATVARATRGDYPGTPFAQELALASAVIRAGFDNVIVHVRLAGFDTHAVQNDSHPQLLQVYAAAMNAFLTDLKKARRLDDVLVFTFSEFGRRVRENASLGTDHGAAGPVFLLGGRVRGGLTGKRPDLKNLDDGDVIHSTDFRDVQACVAGEWLGLPAEPGWKKRELRLLA